ncbi:MAG: hypothetical protein R3E56_11135 [Burkholderiaceae bacterium]
MAWIIASSSLMVEMHTGLRVKEPMHRAQASITAGTACDKRRSIQFEMRQRSQNRGLLYLGGIEVSGCLAVEKSVHDYLAGIHNTFCTTFKPSRTTSTTHAPVQHG